MMLSELELINVINLECVNEIITISTLIFDDTTLLDLSIPLDEADHHTSPN